MREYIIIPCISIYLYLFVATSNLTSVPLAHKVGLQYFPSFVSARLPHATYLLWVLHSIWAGYNSNSPAMDYPAARDITVM